MSIDSNQAQLGKSFTFDLQQIRKQKNVSLIDLHRTTRIPVEVLSAFEYNGLVDRPNYHMVYLRSLVREYARQLDLEESIALESLEAFKMGNYKGQLAQRYLNVDVKEGEKPVQQSPVEEEVKAAPVPPVQVPEDEEAPEKEPDEEHINTLISTVNDEPPGVIRPSRKSISARRNRATGLSGTKGLYMVLGIIGVLVVAAGLWYVLGTGGTDTDVETADEQIPIMPEAGSTDPVQAEPVIGDSMRVSITAVNGTLSPVQVSVDSAVAIPYWVEVGDSIEFNVARQIEIRNWLENTAVRVQGESWPGDRRTNTNSILITRDDAVRYLDSLRFSSN